MSSSLSQRMEQILDRFDAAWNGSTPPRIEDYLAAGNPQERLALLIELVRIDLERRLAQGERPRVEDYSRRFPELFADSSALITLAKHEFELRRRNEPDIMPTEFLERFPQCQTDLFAQLQTLIDKPRASRRDSTEFTLSEFAATDLDLRGYELMEQLGKGGMGEVYRCSDAALGRDLAIKIIATAYRGHPEAERRFVREARVTGSLQHPGIVPVHNLGRLRDGRLHYTMRLVRGRTFADILKDEAGKPERLPYLLTIFERTCQAVAYAHSKRVIHRDLKPHNVMVGPFGEVQVMDWGLAKVLTPENVASETEEMTDEADTRLAEEASTPIDLSRMGSAMGTPAYMPPEQARGEWDAVDERADVFSLGSVLCEMLTGKPAYRGTDIKEVYHRAKHGEVAEALGRLEQCGADAALTALCRACLSPGRDNRPGDAAAVAKRVAEYQAEVQERLQRAEVERAEAQLKARAERKQRHMLIGFLLVLLAAAAVTTWQAVRATAERDDKEIALGQAKTAAQAEREARVAEAAQREKAEEQKSRAETNEHKAKESAEDTKAVLGFFQDKVLSAGRPEGQEGGLGQKVLLRQAVDVAEPEIEASFADRPLVAALIRATLGLTYWYLGDYPKAIQQHARALELREANLGPDHPDTLTSRNNLALAYHSARRLADAIRLHERNLKLYEATLGPDHPDTLHSRNNLAAAYHDAGRTLEAIPLHEQTLKQKEATLGPDHPDTLQSRNNLAVAYRAVGRLKDAIRMHEQTLERRQVTLGSTHPDTLRSLNNLAVVYEAAGRIDDAIRLYKQALEQMEAKLGPDHSDALTARNNLAVVYLSAGRINDAIRLDEKTLKLMEAKHGRDHLDTLFSMAHLGVAYRRAGRFKDAVPLFEQALERGRKHAGGLPANLAWVPGALADTYDRTEQYAKAETLHRELLEQARRQFDTDDPRTAGQMAVLASNLLLQHKYSDAEPLLRDCLKIRQAKQPDAWETFNTQSLLGAALCGQKKFAEAEPLLVQGYDGMKAREDKIPRQAQGRLTDALERLVQLYESMNKKDEAAKWRKQGEERKAAQKQPKAG